MSDVDDLKELLPLAARACGLSQFDGAHYWHEGAGQWVRWNPLTPGDGAEMKDKLRISVERMQSMVVCQVCPGPLVIEKYADHPDEGTARR